MDGVTQYFLKKKKICNSANMTLVTGNICLANHPWTGHSLTSPPLARGVVGGCSIARASDPQPAERLCSAPRGTFGVCRYFCRLCVGFNSIYCVYITWKKTERSRVRWCCLGRMEWLWANWGSFFRKLFLIIGCYCWNNSACEQWV